MSSDERPELAALAELERVVEHVKDELASWRRRALKAEADRTSSGASNDAAVFKARIKELEADKAALVGRLKAARARVDDLLARLRFLEEQVELEEQNR